jgi:hypothetical protein
MTANPKHRRFRSRVHLAHVGEQSCCVPGCGAWPVEVHHLLMGPEPKGRGIKASDYWTVPLCHAHHLGQDSPHHHGNEDQWAESHHVHLMSVAWQMVWYSPARIQIIEHERESQSANFHNRAISR